MQIVVDLRGVFLLYVLSCFGFGLAIYIGDPAGTFEDGTAVTALNWANFVFYASLGEGGPYDYINGTIQTFWLIATTILLTMITFNMMVAVMNDTFQRVQENIIVTETLEEIYLSYEPLKVLKFLVKIFCPRRAKERYFWPEWKRKSYLFVAEETGAVIEEEEAENTQQALGSIQAIKTSMKEYEGNFKLTLGQFKSYMTKKMNEVQFNTTGINSRIKKYENRFARVEKNLNIDGEIMLQEEEEPEKEIPVERTDTLSRAPLKSYIQHRSEEMTEYDENRLKTFAGEAGIDLFAGIPYLFSNIF